MHEIVQYHNDMNKVSFAGFNEKELNIFFSLVFLAKEQGTKELTIPFSDLKVLSNNNLDNHKKRFIGTLKALNKKLLSLNAEIQIKNTTYLFTLFNVFGIDTDNKVLTVKVNEIFSYVLNDFVGNFTIFELNTYVKLKSSYSKHMYRILKQWDSKKEKTFSVEELRKLLGVPVKYNNSQFNERVFKPINDELKTVLLDFNIKKNKKGVKIVSYTFTWKSSEVNDLVIDYKEDEKIFVVFKPTTRPKIKELCTHNHFVQVVLREEENLKKLALIFKVEQNEKGILINDEALIKGIEYACKKVKTDINFEYLKKAVQSGAEIKKTKYVIVEEEVAVPIPKEVPKVSTEQPAPTVPVEDKVEVPKVKVEETNSELAEFEKLSKEEQSKIEDIAIELYKKDNGVQANPILNMRNTNIFKNLMKKYILQAMNGEEVPTEQPAVEVPKIEEQSIEQKEEKKVYTIEDIPADKLLSKAGKKLGGVALQARIEKILKEMNGE